MPEPLDFKQHNSPENTPRTSGRARDDFLGDMKVRGFTVVDAVIDDFDPFDGPVPKRFDGSRESFDASLTAEDRQEIRRLARLVTREIMDTES